MTAYFVFVSIFSNLCRTFINVKQDKDIKP